MLFLPAIPGNPYLCGALWMPWEVREIQFFSDLGAWTYLSGLQTHLYRDVSTVMSQRRKMVEAGGVGILSLADST
jgi:hypothetical protein